MNIDYDIQGLLSVRLINPSPSLARVAARQLNPLQPATLSHDPDISISHFPAESEKARGYRLGDAGDGQQCRFDEIEFSLAIGDAVISIPFDSVGQSCAIRCTRNTNMRRLFIDYVRPALHICLLPKGALALHSAAVSYNGKGILLAGWAESGKTEAMLGLLQAGATFVSDKWTIVDGKGPSIRHFPTPITVRNWMIDLVPGLSDRLKTTERLRARAAGVAGSLLGTAGASSRVPGLREAKGLADLGGRVSVTPSQLFGNTHEERSRWGMSSSAPLESLFLLMTTAEEKITVQSAETAEVARQLADCAAYERRAFFGLYQRFRYALPGRRNTLLEEASHREAETLAKVLASKKVYKVYVPFPFNPAALRDAIGPFCE
jgi:hypothetical protein